MDCVLFESLREQRCIRDASGRRRGTPTDVQQRGGYGGGLVTRFKVCRLQFVAWAGVPGSPELVPRAGGGRAGGSAGCGLGLLGKLFSGWVEVCVQPARADMVAQTLPRKLCG